MATQQTSQLNCNVFAPGQAFSKFRRAKNVLSWLALHFCFSVVQSVALVDLVDLGSLTLGRTV